jgi:hypothetical protein
LRARKRSLDFNTAREKRVVAKCIAHRRRTEHIGKDR